MKKGLFIGRFQPFHLGHLSAIKQALKQVDFLMIGIGSSQYGGEPKNPFPAKKRRNLIKLSLEEAKIPTDKYQIVEVPDIHDNEKWPSHVRSIVPDFDAVFVGDDGLVKELFEKYTETPVVTVDREVDINATKIREWMESGGGWKQYLSSSVVKKLEN